MNGKTNNRQCFEVKADAPLLEWLLANVDGMSRTRVKAVLRGGGIFVNGHRQTQFDHQLHAGDRVEVSRRREPKPFRSRYLRIVYEDQWLIVVEKMPGILSMAAGHKSLNMKTVLDGYFASRHEQCHAHVVHRLDRDTSGLMIFAKDMQTARLLEADWHRTVYDRRYVALLSGLMEHDEGTIENWLKDNAACFTYSSPVDNGGKYAITHFHVLERGQAHTLCEFQLETGRKNQIRVHAADMGHPVCGDIKYGNGDDPCHRLCLHAYVLCFVHPITHQRLEFDTPVPREFIEAL